MARHAGASGIADERAVRDGVPPGIFCAAQTRGAACARAGGRGPLRPEEWQKRGGLLRGGRCSAALPEAS